MNLFNIEYVILMFHFIFNAQLSSALWMAEICAAYSSLANGKNQDTHLAFPVGS